MITPKNIVKLFWYRLRSNLTSNQVTKTDYDRKFWFSYLKNFVSDINLQSKPKGDFEVIDVLIPAVERDLNTLKYAIQSLKKFSCNPINQIYIVAPDSEKISDFAQQNGCIYVKDQAINNIKKNDIKYSVDGLDRSGWLFQQLVKLSWTDISSAEYCLIFDADTMILRDQVFVTNQRKLVLNCSDEYHTPYYAVFKKLLKRDVDFPLSFVSHYMIFERGTTIELQKRLDELNNTTWIKAILNHCDYNSHSGFSEYELYGHYMYLYHRNSIIVNYWYNQLLTRKEFERKDEFFDASKYKSASCHWYNS
ncbi:DUF6492 family protein [Mucilaginibacter sp. CSA2-8R]|uniref:DUF6492 family protein n=1 Tax=Mucilaginibacter sp. CSA2-8R TaxID=3141542 RepID=UPI00315DD69C